MGTVQLSGRVCRPYGTRFPGLYAPTADAVGYDLPSLRDLTTWKNDYSMMAINFYARIFSSLLMVPPRMAMRSASLSPGCVITLSTGVKSHGNG